MWNRNEREDPQFLPLGEAALRLGQTREQLLRQIQRHVVKGTFRNGRWWVDRSELPAANEVTT